MVSTGFGKRERGEGVIVPFFFSWAVNGRQWENVCSLLLGKGWTTCTQTHLRANTWSEGDSAWFQLLTHPRFIFRLWAFAVFLSVILAIVSGNSSQRLMFKQSQEGVCSRSGIHRCFKRFPLVGMVLFYWKLTANYCRYYLSCFLPCPFSLLIFWTLFFSFIFFGAYFSSSVQKIPWVGEVWFWGEKGIWVKRFSSMGTHSHHHLSCHLPSCLWNTSHGFYTLDCSCRHEESSLHINYRSGKWLL